ncbi:hypothetical protein M9Y10_041258 [Tritrichomonas musculus]|uniref:beta-N-acetylhexosaminidase n=1 Tax=Tritrichomonas musculus TaxID=1915356 RepID=A0ABR2K429_9EUKA
MNLFPLILYFISADLPKTPIIIPQPLDFQINDGYFTLDSNTGLSFDSSFPNLSFIVNYAKSWIYGATQFNLRILSLPMNIGIVFDTPNDERNGLKELKDEEYYLTITKERVLIVSSSYNGFFYGFTTFLQLMPPQIYNLDPDIECSLVTTEECRKYDWEPNKGVEWSSPCVTIKDKPRFGYRGILLDTSRHFFSVDVIKRLIRFIAMLKINHFQIHLTDDQGNRFESLKYPGFQTVGSIRKSSPKPWDASSSDGTQYGPFYYTQAQLRELVRYASQLGVTIVPEFELPGHALGALAPYCQYSCRQEPLRVACKWGNSFEVFCPGNDETIKFLEDVFDEIMDIFPSKFIHIGGDEVLKSRWRFCSKCKSRMKEEGLQEVEDLQTWMISHFADYFESRGRRLVGWGEIIQSKTEVSKSAIIMNWQGIKAAINATDKNHNTIDGSNRHFYFNYKQFPAEDVYEYNSPSDFVPFWYTYQKDPFYLIEANKTDLILGVQAAGWSEYIWGDEPDLHYKLFPRTTALSEIGWTENISKNWDRFYTGYVRSMKKRLEYMGVMMAPLMLHNDIGWSKDDLNSDGSFNTVKWNVTKSFNRVCSYDIAFIKTGGNSDCDLLIKNVKILVDGSELISLNEEKIAGFGDDGNYGAFYHFKIDNEIGNDQIVELQADVSGTNKNIDCEGTIVIYATEFKSPYPTP